MRLCRLLSVTTATLLVPIALSAGGALDLVSTAHAQRGGAKPGAKPAPKPASAKPNYAKAKLHYAAAEKAAAAKKWNEAAKEYGVAYEITRDPVLFFKLGNAYQLSGDCTRAVEYFERYLAEANPSEEYQSDSKSRITTCQSNMANTAKSGSGTQGSGDANAASDSTGNRPLEPSMTTDANASSVTGSGDELVGPAIGVTQPSFMDEEATWQQTAAWTSVGVSAAFLTASAVLGLSASSREEDIENLLSYRDASGRPANFDATISERYETLEDEGESLTRYSLIALGGAGVAAAAAIVFFVIDDDDESEEGLSSLTPTIDISPNGQSTVGVGWSF
tara:strand:+ start:334769 stop:335773 length:1005 start_codon:yes stop_codon:yes gene_type:complete